VNHRTRVPAAAVLALVLGGLGTTAAQADSAPLNATAVGDLAVANCQADPNAPLTAEEMAPVVVGESDVEVVPGELTAHIVRVDVTTSLGDVRECTFGVLHRDALLPQVQYQGTATLALADGLGATVASATTDVEIGNMGHGSPVDPTTEVPLAGFLVPLDVVATDPTYSLSLSRKSLEVVPIAVDRTVKNAAGRLLKAQTKAAAQLQRKQLKAAKSKHSDKAVAAAKRAYDKRVAAAQAAYVRATTPKTVTRPVSRDCSVDGSVALS
jgi:hypothetical protein